MRIDNSCFQCRDMNYDYVMRYRNDIEGIYEDKLFNEKFRNKEITLNIVIFKHTDIGNNIDIYV